MHCLWTHDEERLPSPFIHADDVVRTARRRFLSHRPYSLHCSGRRWAIKAYTEDRIGTAILIHEYRHIDWLLIVSCRIRSNTLHSVLQSDVFSEFRAHCLLWPHSILCTWFYVSFYCTQYCNSIRMTCSIKRLLILLPITRVHFITPQRQQNT